MAIRSFRDLVAWQKAKSLAMSIYGASANMPDSERFGLCSQMRRASISVFSNIAEGFGRGSDREFLRGCRNARGSLFELMGQVEIAMDLGYMKASEELTGALEETDRVLQGLIRSIETRIEQAP